MLSLISPAGRIGRGLYWLTGVIQLLGVVGLCTYILAIPVAENPRTGFNGPLFFLLGAVVIWIGICASIKRFHDRGKSAWWILIALVPFIGGIWMFIELGILPGDQDANEYGEPGGSGGRRAVAMTESSGLDLTKFDDEYFKARLAQVAQTADAASSRTDQNVRPSFGKRV
jgi:uncharacterized membrane protein YhaH (DUF805 family)